MQTKRIYHTTIAMRCNNCASYYEVKELDMICRVLSIGEFTVLWTPSGRKYGTKLLTRFRHWNNVRIFLTDSGIWKEVGRATKPPQHSSEIRCLKTIDDVAPNWNYAKLWDSSTDEQDIGYPQGETWNLVGNNTNEKILLEKKSKSCSSKFWKISLRLLLIGWCRCPR